MTEKEFNRFKLHNRLLDIIPIIINIMLVILIVIAGIDIVQQMKLDKEVIQEQKECIRLNEEMYCKVEK